MKQELLRIRLISPNQPTQTKQFKSLLPQISFLAPWTESPSELYFAILNDLHEKPKCDYCGNPRTFYNINKGYSHTCGKKSCAAKFSFDSNPGLKQIHSKLQTGRKHTDASKEKMRQKAKITNSNPSKIERTRQAVREKYGVDNVFQLEDVKNLSRLTCLKKYGVAYNLQRNELKESNRNWMIQMNAELNEKFGTTNIMHVPEFFEKSQTNNNRFKHKFFTFPSGNRVKVQGYEPQALQQLLDEGFTEDELVVSSKVKPKIKYFFDGSQRRYYCDIWIPSRNLIVEVKSDYTWNKAIEKTIEKVKATVSSGFNYRLIKFN